LQRALPVCEEPVSILGTTWNNFNDRGVYTSTVVPMGMYGGP